MVRTENPNGRKYTRFFSTKPGGSRPSRGEHVEPICSSNIPNGGFNIRSLFDGTCFRSKRHNNQNHISIHTDSGHHTGVSVSRGIHHDYGGGFGSNDGKSAKGNGDDQMGSHRIPSYDVLSGDHANIGGSRKGNRKMIHLRITPDSRLDNTHVENLAQSLCIYTSPLDRWNGKGFDRPNFISFETVLEPDATAFYMTVPEDLESVARKAIESTWPKVAIESESDPLTDEPHKVTTMTLNNHYMFALKVDKRTLGASANLLDTVSAMEPKEKVYIQTIATPGEKDWYVSAAAAYERFKKGEMPRKIQFNKKGMVQQGVKVLAAVALETANLTAELVSGEGIEKIDLNGSERAVILREGKLSTATLNKTRAEAYEVEIRIGVIANDNKRATALMRMVTSSFRELDGDNQLIPVDAKIKRMWLKMFNRKVGAMISKDYLSVAELSRLHLLPTAEWQEKYNIPSINTLQLDVSESFTANGGLLLGELEIKKEKKNVYQPIDNHDILCLPRVIIGGMGAGKSSMVANLAVEAVLNGFGAIVIDPAKGEIGDEIESFLHPDQIIRIKLGERPISLDWREVSRSPKSKNRLANTILGFFNTSNEEAGPQTARYIRAAVMAMKTGRLSEIMHIFEDENYRDLVISGMPVNIHKNTLNSFGEESEGRQRQILSPIYNRLDIILGDEYLAECMETEDGIDMVELMEQKKAVIIDIPKGLLGPEAVDLIVNLISTKLDLAMTLRDPDKQHPVFFCIDEPHQMLKSSRIWKNLAVESRKWRLGMVFSFHSWEQIPDNLAEIIKSAGPHYTIYSSSKKTFRELSSEIAPYTYEDGLKLKRHHAINIMRSENGMEAPYILHMTPPPSKRKNNYK